MPSRQHIKMGETGNSKLQEHEYEYMKYMKYIQYMKMVLGEYRKELSSLVSVL